MPLETTTAAVINWLINRKYGDKFLNLSSKMPTITKIIKLNKIPIVVFSIGVKNKIVKNRAKNGAKPPALGTARSLSNKLNLWASLIVKGRKKIVIKKENMAGNKNSIVYLNKN